MSDDNYYPPGYKTPEWALERIRECEANGGTELILDGYERNQEKLKFIPPEIQHLFHLALLDIRSNNVTGMPQWLRELPKLTQLDLRGNNFCTLPYWFASLTKLEALSIAWNEFTEIPEVIASLARLSYLSITMNNLKHVPNFLGDLSLLNHLGMSWTNLTEIPQWLTRLTNLTSISIGGNQLEYLPEFITRLSKLNSLVINWNNLTKLPCAIGDLLNLTVLDAHSNHLSELPESIGNNSKLTSLIVSSNELTKLPSTIGELHNLEILDVGSNRLTKLPDTISNFKNLKSLSINSNRISNLPDDLGQLIQLEYLNISNNKIEYLPECVIKLHNLLEIDFSRNKLSSLPDIMYGWVKLNSLNISGNKLSEIPSSLSQLSHLALLNMSDNQLTVLPTSLTQLEQLATLIISWNKLEELPTEINKLTNLKVLGASGIELKELPPSLGSLAKLSILNLSGNHLTYLPDFIRNNKNLTSLAVSHNSITAIPEWLIDLEFLTELTVNGNALKTLPEFLAMMPNLVSLVASSNPLDTPPREVAEQGLTAIRKYYQQLHDEGTDTLLEAKMLIVGEPGAGKTTLAHKILNKHYILDNQLGTTNGIDVIRYNYPTSNEQDFRINIWDFGGQQIYHATHQFFLTKRSLYVLVADVRKENTDFDYWLNIVELLGEGSPLLVVRNEKQDRKRQLPIQQLKGRFKCLKDDYAVNLADNRGLHELMEAIRFHIQKLPHVGDTVPKTWAQVRNALDENGHNWISLDAYLDMCEENGFKRHADKLQLSGYLHDLGVIVHFQDDPVLKNTVFLNPEWITDAVYKVLDSPAAINNLGRFTLNDLEEIWEDAHILKRDEIVAMMSKFQLCYPLADIKGAYIAPQLLGLDAVEHEWDDADNLQVQYVYEFMPKGILSRLIVALHQYIADQKCVWRTGVVLKRDGAMAEVLEDYPNRRITVRLSGVRQRDLRTVIDAKLEEIHRSFPGLKYQILVPCTCEQCIESTDPHFFPRDLLRGALDKGGKVQCQKSYELVDASPLLYDFQPAREERQMKETINPDDYDKRYPYIEHAETVLITESGTAINASGAGAQVNAPFSQTGNAEVKIEQAPAVTELDPEKGEPTPLPPEFRTFTMIGALVAIIGLMVVAFGMFVGQLADWIVLLVFIATLLLVLTMPLFDLRREDKLDNTTLADLFSKVLTKYGNLISTGKSPVPPVQQ